MSPFQTVPVSTQTRTGHSPLLATPLPESSLPDSGRNPWAAPLRHHLWSGSCLSKAEPVWPARWASLCWWSPQALCEKLPAPSTMPLSEPVAALPGEGGARTTITGSGCHRVGQSAVRPLFCVAISLGETGETGGPREDPAGWVMDGACQSCTPLLHSWLLCVQSRTVPEEEAQGVVGRLLTHPELHIEDSACIRQTSSFWMLYIRHFAQQPWVQS